MLPALAVAAVLLALALAAWAALYAVRDRAVLLRQLKGAAVVEAVLVLQVVVAAVEAARGTVPDDAVTFWGYLLTALVVLPVAAVWAFAERSRWSSVVLLVAALTIVVMQWRLLQIWGEA